MRDAGMAIGSHSRTHPYLTRSDALTREVTGSRRDIERELGCAPEFFAYPFGEHNERLAGAVRDAGYHAARGFGGGKKHRPEHLWNLHSIPVTANMSAFRRNVGIAAK
jgi:peptidoglycan/xylan/chitin deacetylase (PgdA/CDA1 family)